MTDELGTEPLHRRIAADLRAAIEDGTYAAGERLPSELDLAARHGVSRSVVRQALSALAVEGLLRKERGRRSVVVARPRYQRYVSRSAGLYEQLRRRGLAVGTRVLRFEEADLPHDAAAFLGQPRGLILERVREVAGEPLAFIQTCLPAERCAALLDEDLHDRSLHEALATVLRLRIASGRRTVEAVAAPEHVAEALTITPGSPMLLLHSEATDQRGHPLEWFRTWHRNDRVAFEIRLQPNGDEGDGEEFDVATPSSGRSREHVPPAAEPVDRPVGERARLPRVVLIVEHADPAMVAELTEHRIPLALGDPGSLAAIPRDDRGSVAVVRVRDRHEAARAAGLRPALLIWDGPDPPPPDLAGPVAVPASSSHEVARACEVADAIVVEPAWVLGPRFVRWVVGRSRGLSVVAADLAPHEAPSYLEAGAAAVLCRALGHRELAELRSLAADTAD